MPNATIADRIRMAWKTGKEAKFYGTSDPLSTGTEFDFSPSGIASYLADLLQTLTNKTLTSPVIVTPVIQPAASATPATNGDVVIQATSNTSLTFKLKG